MAPRSHRRRQSVLLLSTGLLTCTIPLPAEAETAPIAPGARIRLQVAAPEEHWIIGELLAATSDTLRVAADSGETTAIPAAAASELQISRGRGSHAGKGAVIGGSILGAAGLGLGIGLAADGYFAAEPSEVVALTLLSASAGAAIGALLGWTSSSEKWEELPAPWLTSAANSGVPAAGLQMSWRW